ncbi:MAG: LemA family protein [Nitrospirota bacterium]|nr:LemA family protein [Nitrospirota bacterium]
MKEVIKKLYAEELGLITQEPAPLKYKEGWRDRLRHLKARYWDTQSTAVKTAIVALTLTLISAFIYYHNFFIVELYKVRLERAQIEAELQRRNDLIPNLVKAVNDYMTYEGQVFLHAADVRGALTNIKNIPLENPSALSIQSALSRFQAVAENYPVLKTSDTYQNLMKELSNTETRIADARNKYNVAVNFYNSRLRMFPGIIFGTIMFYHQEPTFEAAHDAKHVPQVK